MEIRLEGLDHVALIVREQARSITWYRDVLGFEQVHADAWGTTPAMLVAPDSRTGVALFQAKDPAASRATPGSIAVAHVAFRTSREAFAVAQTALSKAGITFRLEDHEVSQSIYFADPDGHQLEITTYEV